MATIYEKTPGALVATPGRTVATFPSGLCRVDQTYTCATAHAAAHRATLAVGNDMPDGNTAPAIDGLKIFPAPQEVERGDGFTEFVVSAYGRTHRGMLNYRPSVKTYNRPSCFFSVMNFSGSTTVKNGESLEYSDLGLDPASEQPFGFIASNPDFSVESVTYEALRPTLEINWDGSITPNILSRATARIPTSSDTGIGSSTYYKKPIIVADSIKNFGDFTEIDITTKIQVTGDGLGIAANQVTTYGGGGGGG